MEQFTKAWKDYQSLGEPWCSSHANEKPQNRSKIMSLQEKLDAFKADFETNKAPAAAIEAFHRSTRELIEHGNA